MSRIQERQAEIIQDFSRFQDWEDRYKLMIEMGKKLPELSAQDRVEKNLIKGCQSQVWVLAELNDQGEMILRGDSDALLVKGLVALIIKVYSGSPPEEILQYQPLFLKELGFESHLSPSRANGLHSMIRQIHLFATAFSLLKKNTFALSKK